MLFIRLGCILPMIWMFIIGATNTLKLTNEAKKGAMNDENDVSLPENVYHLLRTQRGNEMLYTKPGALSGLLNGNLHKRSIQNEDDSSIPSEEMTLFPKTNPPRGKRAVKKSKNHLPRLLSNLRRNKRSVNDTQETNAASRGDGVTEPIQFSVSEKETTSQTSKKSEESISTKENESSTEISKKVDGKSEQHDNATVQVYQNVFSLIGTHFFTICKTLQNTSQCLGGHLKSMFMEILDSLTRFSTQAFTVTRKLFLWPVPSSKSFVNSTLPTNISNPII